MKSVLPSVQKPFRSLIDRSTDMNISPEAADAFNAANSAYREGRHDAALAFVEKSVALSPDYANAQVLKARILRQFNDENAALEAYLAALRIAPDHFDALLEAGNILRKLGENEAAEKKYQSAMRARPADPRPALALTILYEGLPGQVSAEKAAIALQKALNRASAGNEPRQATAKIGLDLARQRLTRSDLSRALEALRYARLLAGTTKLGQEIDLEIAETFLRLGLKDEAEALMQQLSAANDVRFLKSLAHLSYRYNYWAEAVAILKRATEISPEDPQIFLDLADMEVKSWLLEDAFVSVKRAEALGSVPKAVLTALRASIANRMGDAETALSHYDELVAEGQQGFVSNCAMSMLYSDRTTPEGVAQRHRELFAAWGEGARPIASFQVDRTAGRPIRVGFVTGDLHHQHPVNIFMQPLMARWNNERLPSTVYYNGHTVDEQTRLARSRVSAWHDLSSADLPARVEADKIDVLIDLAGHTAGGTGRLFAKRMAPVQVSFLGYPGSTGVPNIDWLIGDPVVTPQEMDHLCSERVLRLPHTVFCFAPEKNYPLPDFGKLASNRPLTFGSFNNIPKLTPRTIRLWSEVLKAVPNSRLLLRAPSFKDAAAVDRFQRLFAEHEIERDRLLFRGPVGLDVMMQAYDEVDIALDPVPYCGGTTSLQAMWMGVPVLTLMGGHFVSRMGASFMQAADLPDWIAQSDADYVALAAEFSSDRTSLTALKAGLRSRLLGRPGWDADLYARDFQDAISSAFRALG